jgi:hypothetical protein
VLYVAKDTAQRTQWFRPHLKAGDKVWMNLNCKMYEGTVKMKLEKRGLLVGYDSHPGQDQLYEKREWRHYVCIKNSERSNPQ